MTDKINDKKLESMKGEPLNPQDEELLQMFFSDCQMSEIPDDGFSDRVMQALPALPDTDTAMSLVKRQRLEHLWTAACVAAGIIIAVVCQMGADSGMAFLYEDRFPPLRFACPYACGRFHRPLSESPDGAGWHRCPHHGLGI